MSQEKISEDDVRLIVAELGLGHHGDDIAESTSKRGVLEALLSVFEVSSAIYMVIVTRSRLQVQGQAYTTKRITGREII